MARTAGRGGRCAAGAAAIPQTCSTRPRWSRRSPAACTGAVVTAAASVRSAPGSPAGSRVTARPGRRQVTGRRPQQFVGLVVQLGQVRCPRRPPAGPPWSCRRRAARAARPACSSSAAAALRIPALLPGRGRLASMVSSSAASRAHRPAALSLSRRPAARPGPRSRRAGAAARRRRSGRGPLPGGHGVWRGGRCRA